MKFVIISLSVLLGACGGRAAREQQHPNGPDVSGPAETEPMVAEGVNWEDPRSEERRSKPKETSHSRASVSLPPLYPDAPGDVARPGPGATCTASGLCFLRVSSPHPKGAVPGEEDRVTVHYSGWTRDGKLFDSSVERGTPATFGLKQVIKGWTEGVQEMREAETFRFWIPPDLAYGETPRRPGAPAGQLTFEVQLLEVIRAPEAPQHLAAPPAGATCTPTGLCYLTVKPGDRAAARPQDTDRVTVHYSGWNQQGKLFDSSITRGKPSSFPVSGVIRGWTEMLQLMHVGEKVLVWIPPELAYGTNPTRQGAPSGQLTFEIELLEVNARTNTP